MTKINIQQPSEFAGKIFISLLNSIGFGKNAPVGRRLRRGEVVLLVGELRVALPGE